MEEPKKEIPINAEEMESLILKYINEHNVNRREAERMVCSNGFHNKPKRLGEVTTPPNNP